MTDSVCRHDVVMPLEDSAVFAGVTYDLNSSYTDRTGSVWRFEDTVSDADRTWDMSSSDHCYKESLADVVLNWGPLRVHATKPPTSLFYRHT
ncbi:phiSA1p31-related protein [Streptomyces gardneri]|uniref:phiSA1p31-related protein n=1 Tax=Streptomyces gardneri TaxID=66892 RepID=UPI0035D8B36D